MPPHNNFRAIYGKFIDTRIICRYDHGGKTMDARFTLPFVD